MGRFPRQGPPHLVAYLAGPTKSVSGQKQVKFEFLSPRGRASPVRGRHGPGFFMTKRNRKVGYISGWVSSPSGGYGFCKSGREKFFFHSSAVLEGIPEVGAVIVFTQLPGNRATEVEVVRPAKKK